MLTVSQWADYIKDEKGRERALGAAAALTKGFPLLAWLQYLTIQGQSYTTNFTGASVGGATRELNNEFTKGTPSLGSYTFPMRVAGGKFELDTAMLRMDNTGTLRPVLLSRKIVDQAKRLWRMFFTGDKDDAGNDQFQGLNEFASDMGKQVEAGTNGATITSDMMDDLLDLVPGANFILCNRTLARQISKLEVGIQKTIELHAGKEAPEMFDYSYKGRPIIPVRTAPADDTGTEAEILPFNETQGTSGVCSRVTAVRVGILDGIYGVQNAPMDIRPPRREDEFETNFMEWVMTPLAADSKDAVGQIIGVTAA